MGDVLADLGLGLSTSARDVEERHVPVGRRMCEGRSRAARRVVREGGSETHMTIACMVPLDLQGCRAEAMEALAGAGTI